MTSIEIRERKLILAKEVQDCISLLKSKYGAVLTKDSGHGKEAGSKETPLFIYTLPKLNSAQIGVPMNKVRLSLYIRGTTIDGKIIAPLITTLATITKTYGPQFWPKLKPHSGLHSIESANYLTPKLNPLLLISPHAGALSRILEIYFGTSSEAISKMSTQHSSMVLSAIEMSRSPATKTTDAEQVDLESDTKSLKTDEKEAVVKVRFGQGDFRTALMKIDGEKCWMTGIEGKRLLIASHIKPWSQCADDTDSRGQPNNGLLLSALWDTAFDAGLLSFEPDWSVVCSSELSQSAKDALGLQERVVLPEKFRTNARSHYLAFHRANIFEYWRKLAPSERGH